MFAQTTRNQSASKMRQRSGATGRPQPFAWLAALAVVFAAAPTLADNSPPEVAKVTASQRPVADRLWAWANDGQGPGGEIILVPAGEYQMGDQHGGMVTALPVHAVYIDAFYMDTYEVTNQQYADGLNWAWSQGGLITVITGQVYKAGSGTNYPYCETTTSSSFSRITWDGSTFGVVAGKEDHPMVMVSWYGAAAYANWRSAQEGRTPCYNLDTWSCDFVANGYRLPTEAEWEKAARGGEHSPYYRYAWGDDIDGSKANYYDSGDPYETGPFPCTTPVGYYDGGQTPPGPDMANGYGLYDMAGNVYEWCNDWYDSDYYSWSPYENPRGPSSSSHRVLRGGSWSHSEDSLRCASRMSRIPGGRHHYRGFRLALVCIGDLNGDGYRNKTDFMVFAGAYGSRLGDPNYDPDADLSSDGSVNVTDFTIFAGYYLVPCP